MNERSPRYMERVLAVIHQANRRRVPICFEYGTHEGRAGLFLHVPDALSGLVTNPITANYPNCSIIPVQSDEGVSLEWETWSAELDLVPELYPILRHAQFEDLLNGTFADPIASVLRSIRPDGRVRCRIEIILTPAFERRCRVAAHAVKRLDREFFHRHHRLAHYYAAHITQRHGWFPAWVLGLVAAGTHASPRTTLDTSTSRLHDREDDLVAASEKVGGNLFNAHIRLIAEAPADDHRLAFDRIQQMAGAVGSFTKSRLATFHIRRLRRGNVAAPDGRGFLLSHEELATLFHPPTTNASPERMSVSEFSELEAPATLHPITEKGIVQLAQVRFRDDDRPVTLALEDRRRHVYIVGKTGMGKTTLIQNMLLSDMQAGHGVCLVDPHGDLAEGIVGLVPKHRTNDVVLFDAASRTDVVSFNPLACGDPAHVDQVTSGVVSAFKKIHDSWGPRLEDTLRNAVFATVEHGGNLMNVMRLLGEKAYRELAVPRIRDEVVRGFWMHEFAGWSNNYRTEAVAAIQNKIRPFLTNTNIRGIVSQPGESLNLREIMDAGKILIINLSKGRMGEDNATLLGAFLVTSIQQAAMTRADQPEASRRDFFLYVDEFQNFTTGSFASVLSEARKFRLSLIVAHQYLSQLDQQTADAVWGNVGSIVAFQVGSDDALILSQQLAKYPGQITTENLTGLPKYTAYTRLLIDGMPSNPFSIRTLPPPSGQVDTNRAAIIRRTSHRRNAHSALSSAS